MHIRINIMDIFCSTCNFSRKPTHNLTFRNVLSLHWLLLGGCLFCCFFFFVCVWLFFLPWRNKVFVQSSCIWPWKCNLLPKICQAWSSVCNRNGTICAFSSLLCCWGGTEVMEKKQRLFLAYRCQAYTHKDWCKIVISFLVYWEMNIWLN